MGSRTPGAGRPSAVRRAHQVAERRAEALREHEQAITATLVEYFEAKDRADKIRADAQDRAARLLHAAQEKALKLAEQAREAGQQVIENAEKDACDDDTRVGTAVRRLRELGESASAVADMTGLTPAVVRAVEREHLPPREKNRHTETPGTASKPGGPPGAA